MSKPELQENSTLLGAKSRGCPRWLLIVIVVAIIAILVIAITTIVAYNYKEAPTPTHKDVLPGPIKRPHILLIVADDLGFGDVGYQGSKIRTPVIDELAASGVRLENYYTHQLCSPSRAALMSGYYASNLGMQHDTINAYQPFGLPLWVETLPEMLRESGYATHMMGKWHLGFFDDKYLPNHRGFDTFLGFATGYEDYYTKIGCLLFAEESWCGQDLYNNTGNSTQLVEDQDALTTYSTHLYTQEAVSIISQHDPSQPMFMYMSYQAPHTPIEVPEEYLQEYSWMNDTLLKTYAAMVTCMDEGIGNITDAIKERHMWDNTLVIFASDNGALNWGENSAGSNWPLSGIQGSMWEGALRVPALLSGNVIPEAKRGVSSPALMHVTDWIPTFTQLAGREPPKLDGYPMWDVIINDAVSPRHEVFHIYDPLWVAEEPYTPSIYSQIVNVSETSALRVDQWKIMTGDPGFCQRIPPRYLWREHQPRERECNSTTLVWLFDLENDPYELYNLVDEQPEVALRMLNRLAEYQAGSVYPLCPHPDYRANPAYYNDRWVPWTSSPWVDMFNASILLDKTSQTDQAHPTLSP